MKEQGKQGEMEGMMTVETFEDRLTDLELLGRNDRTTDAFLTEAEKLLSSVLQGKLDQDPDVRQEAEARTKRVLEVMAAQIAWTMFYLSSQGAMDSSDNDGEQVTVQ